MNEWKAPTETPDVPKGQARTFIVAVRRGHNGQVYVFPAAYLNAMPYEHDENDRMIETEDDPPFDFATGWHAEREHYDYDTAYFDLIQKGSRDVLEGWQPLPAWTECTDMRTTRERAVDSGGHSTNAQRRDGSQSILPPHRQFNSGDQ